MQVSCSVVRSLPRLCRETGAVRSIASATTPLMVSSPPASSPSASNPNLFSRTVEEKRLMNHSGEESPYALGKHRSNALELVHKVAPIEVDGEIAICDGGGGGLGHPLEYISLARPGAVESCKYCALRFTKKK